jgi:hypothetical protein
MGGASVTTGAGVLAELEAGVGVELPPHPTSKSATTTSLTQGDCGS